MAIHGDPEMTASAAPRAWGRFFEMKEAPNRGGLQLEGAKTNAQNDVRVRFC
jgi:hypothetical protein